MKILARVSTIFWVGLIGSSLGCATAPPLLLSPMGMKRIAVAQPEKMHDGIFLNFSSNHFRAEPAYREFCDALEAQLRIQGFTVIDYCSRPNTSVIGAVLAVPTVGKDEADVILVPRIELGYYAATVLSSYSIEAKGSYTLIDTKTRKEVGARHLYRSASYATDYRTQEALIADMPHALAELARAGADLGKRIATSIE